MPCRKQKGRRLEEKTKRIRHDKLFKNAQHRFYINNSKKQSTSKLTNFKISQPLLITEMIFLYKKI
jgi:hypothetical protein